MKKNKILFLAIAIVITVVMLVSYILVRDKNRFTAISNDIQSIASSFSGIEKEYSNSYCQRNNLKYSRGSLGCVVETSITVKELGGNISHSNSSLSKVGWVAKGSNLDSWTSVDDSYISSNLYQKEKADCYVRVQEDRQDNKNIITIGCYSDALMEWFPVRE